MKRGNRRYFFATIVIFLFPVIFCGCGKKGDPLPYHVVMPKAISNLEVQHGEGGAVLRWSKEGDANLAGFKITRNETEISSRICLDCPREYTLIADLSLGDPKLTRKEKGIFSYLDSTVRPGMMYAYRVIVCNTSGACSDPSNIAEIK
ncbi:MAG: hypothetical protein WC560_07155 [Syntrophales bacterium]